MLPAARTMIALAGALVVAACQAREPKIRVEQPWARATVQGQPGAVYLRVRNEGGSDRLIAARTSRAAMTMLHSGSTDGGVGRMRPMQGGMEVPAGGAIDFAPGGSHIMLTGLASPLRAGERFAMTLEFERSPDRQVEVQVLSAGAAGPQEPKR